MAVLVHLAFRTLVRSRISFVLLVLAVTAGLGFQIPNTANLDGYTAELRAKGITRDTGHVVVTSRTGGSFAGADELGARIEKEPFTHIVTARFVHAGTVWLGDRSISTRIVGVDPENERRATGFCGDIAEGQCITAKDEKRAVLGWNVAAALGAHAGDTVRVVMPYFEGEAVRIAEARFEVAVLAGAGGMRADYEVFLPIARERALLGKNGEVTELRVFSSDEERAGEWATAVAKIAPERKVEAWWDAHQFIKSAIDANRSISAISTTMVVVAVMIPVLALLYIHVLAERRRIATIAALGFNRLDIFLIHLLQAFFVAALGTALGSVLGWLLCLYFQAHPIFSNAGFVVRPSITLHAFLSPGAVLFATTLVAGIVPAVIAARAEPAIELRSE